MHSKNIYSCIIHREYVDLIDLTDPVYSSAEDSPSELPSISTGMGRFVFSI